MTGDELEYLSVEDVLAIHEVIVESSTETEPGVTSRGNIEYALEHVQSGLIAGRSETLEEKAYQLLRLLVANHPFVDGNKRTALASAVTFYALNGYEFDYDREIKTFLKRLATDESAVDRSELVAYLDDHTAPLEPEFADTYELWLSVADSERS